MEQVPTGRFAVTYADGGVVECKIRPAAIVEAERKWPGRRADNSDAYPMFEGMHLIIWASLGKPGKDFDEWLATVEQVTATDGGADAVPSPPTVTDD